MSPVVVLLILFAFSVGLLLLLACLVLGRKALRDRREARSRRHRQEMTEAMAAGPDAFESSLRHVRGRIAELDLVRVLQDTRPDPAAAFVAARDAGLLTSLERHLGARDAGTRGRAVMLLARLHPDAHHLLRPMLEDRDPEVRLVTCAALAASRDPRAVAVLLDTIEDERLAPERVIERIGAEWAVDALLAAIATTPLERAATRVAITRALGLAGSRAAEPALLELLREGTEEVRISAARSLGQAGGSDSCAELERALADAAWPLRAQAAKALGTIGHVDSVPSLEDRLADSAWWVRANAAQALVDLGPEGLEALERAAEHHDQYARDRAREALALANVTGAAA